MTPDNSWTFLERPEPLCVLLLDTRVGVAAAKSASAEAKKTMQDVQRHFGEGKVQVAWSDGVVFGPQFDLQGSAAEIRKQLPLLVVVKTQSEDLIPHVLHGVKLKRHPKAAFKKLVKRIEGLKVVESDVFDGASVAVGGSMAVTHGSKDKGIDTEKMDVYHTQRTNVFGQLNMFDPKQVRACTTSII